MSCSCLLGVLEVGFVVAVAAVVDLVAAVSVVAAVVGEAGEVEWGNFFRSNEGGARLGVLFSSPVLPSLRCTSLCTWHPLKLAGCSTRHRAQVGGV